MAEHNRWAPNCERFPTKIGPDTQYLIDWHRGETCPVCAEAPTPALSSLAPDTDYRVQIAWHDEPARWERTGHLDQGSCWCPECLVQLDGDDEARTHSG